MFFARRWRRREIRGCPWNNASGGTGAGRGSKGTGAEQGMEVMKQGNKNSGGKDEAKRER
jgi:hypothetical protein